ncbi:MAG: arylsulfatase [Phycisphaeraceae bacterium]|nr:arylsulfatase [Phycisphaeraceae bacterium]
MSSKPRRFLGSTALGLAVCASPNLLAAAPPQQVKPNVLLILADDMAFGDLSRINGGITRTPRLDQLAQQSIRLTRGYSASAVCAPARAAMLTGRYPHRTGVIALNKNTGLTRLRLDETTIADVFAANGYATGMVGKWHCGDGPDHHPLRRGFQEFCGFTEDINIQSYFNYDLFIGDQIQHFDDRYLTDHFTDLAIDYLSRHRDQPFFLHLAHYAPHRPLNAPQELVDFYKDKGFDENIATIYAMIDVLDRGIGRVLDVLDNLGLADNTIVIFTSDNGPDPIPGERFNCDLRGTKYTIHEGGIHVPMIIRWPGHLQPADNDTLVSFIDFLPTLTAACGINLPESLDFNGRNVLDALASGDTAPDPVRFWQWNRGQPIYSHNAAMRDGDWKLVRPFVSRNVVTEESDLPPMLFNLRDDPGENNDLAEQNPQRVADMNAALTAWTQSIERDRTRPMTLPQP